jgi:aspartate--ammonia ligase
VRPETGLNDNLSGVEIPVKFQLSRYGFSVEIVQSLAKWKRDALNKYGFDYGEGLYADMDAIRKDEELDALHSIYVDQWDWELRIRKEQRNLEFLKGVVEKIYLAFKNTEIYLNDIYPGAFSEKLPEEIAFISSQELENLYPKLTPVEREEAITRLYRAVFIHGIGDLLESGQKHDGRSPDYDDWMLNGDILFWNPVLECPVELSSMGIRVDEISLLEQLEKSGTMDRISQKYHQDLLGGRLPYTIGGGIGQSRICMYFLEKRHIGEVQSSIWSDEIIKECSEKNIHLL